MFNLERKSICVYRVQYKKNSFSHNLYVSLNFKICRVIRGSATWQIGGKDYQVQGGDVIVLNTYQKRVFKEVSETEGIEMLVVEFEPRIFATHFYELLYNHDDQFDCKIVDNHVLCGLIDEMELENDNKLSNYQLVLVAKLIEILSLTDRRYQMSTMKHFKMSKEMYQVLDYINNNYSSDISLSNAAAILHMSETYFSKCFLKYIGVGFAQYVMQKRISEAIELLQSSEKNVLEIALECGYNNAASFYKAFKKITNMTPKDYRNKEKNYYI